MDTRRPRRASASAVASGSGRGVADARLGRRVSIAPTDYGTVPVTGTLVAATPSRFVVARETDRFGTLHVHFPQRGYALTEA